MVNVRNIKKKEDCLDEEYLTKCNMCYDILAVIPPKKFLKKNHENGINAKLYDWLNNHNFYCLSCRDEFNYASIKLIGEDIENTNVRDIVNKCKCYDEEYPEYCSVCGANVAVQPPRELLIKSYENRNKSEIHDWLSNHNFYCQLCREEEDYPEFE